MSFVELATSLSYHYQPCLAELTTGSLALIALLSGALAYVLRPKQGTGLRVDDQPTTLSTRGSWLPLTIGERRVAPLIGWAGERRVRQEGGGGKGLGKSGKESVYYEAAWHQLRVGPVNSLLRIVQQGDVIWEGPISRFDTPSGSEIEVDGEGTFVIWWGEEHQPVNDWLGDDSRVGVSSRWPYVCSICWIEKKLGTAAYWPQLEYDIEADCVGSSLQDSNCSMTAQDSNAQDSGMNYAHALYQLVTGDWPHGAGMLGEHVDFGRLEELGVLCQDEHTPCSIDARDGATAADVIADLASDFGFTVCQVGDVLVFNPVRPDDDPAAFTAAHVAPPPLEREVVHARAANRAVFSFQDKQRAYTRNPVRVDDDAGAVDSERSVQQVDLTTVVDYATAEKCAQRKSLQLLAPPTQQRLMMAYTARSLYAGQAFTLDGRPMRVSSVTPSAFSPLVEVVAVDDKYSADDTGFGTGDTGQGGSSGSVAADVIVALVEAPYSAVGAETRLLVLRVRGSEASAAATVWVSSNGSSYASIGTQPTWCFGGTVTVDHEASIRTVDEEGPIVAAVGYGTDVLQDLTGDDDSWRTGRQAALVVETGEIMYVRKTTSLGGGSYRLDDCVRGRAGTQKADVPAGSTIVIFDTSAATTFADRLIAPGTAVWIKSQPRGVELSDVAPAYAEIEGWALAPLPALLHRDGAFYDSSGDAVIEWGYAVRDGDGDAASERPAGAAISDTPAHEGEFLVEIVDPSDDSVVRTGTVDSDSPSYTYTSAQRTADFGAADPTFIVRVTNVLGSRSSPSREMTVQAY